MTTQLYRRHTGMDDRIEQLEAVTMALSQDLSEIKHDMKAIRSSLAGSADGLQEGAIPRLNRHLNNHHTEILQLKANGFTAKERDRILHVVSFFEGWKIVIAAVIYLIPLLTLIISLIR
jgi:predicted RNase H-like nuclease (RuvC/YqgF family)